MPLEALIFDVDGTIADTEQEGHLPASNEAMALLGYPIQWTWEEFKQLLVIPGNGNRFRNALNQLEPPLSPAEIDAAVIQFITLKQQLYIEKYLPRLSLRPGVARLIREAQERGVRLAIVSTSHEAQIKALLRARLSDVASEFSPILGKESGTKTLRDSTLYERCIRQLRIAPHNALVIEDSASGMNAALKAGLPVAVIYNDYTVDENFTGAALVARSLMFFTLEQLEALCLPLARRSG
jgi:HAD superfamily hydrolase (TIGR01509 family)